MTINRALWLSSFILFGLGIYLPMFSMEKFYIFTDTFSLLGGLHQLLINYELFLFLLIFLFSIVMPLAKFFVSFNLVFDRFPSPERKLQAIKQMAFIGKWSMADVFVIAVLASTIKVGGFAHVSIHLGLVMFGASVLVLMALSERLMADYELRLKAQ